MWTLNKPSVRSAKAQLKKALTLKCGTALYTLNRAERSSIKAAYQLYDQQRGRHHVGLKTCGLTTLCCNAIDGAYREVQKGGRLKSLRQSLLDGADLCPFCGFSEPTQLDHYLPRSDYKPLAIYARNLIPTCGPCNNAKRRHVGGATNEFIHPYFDILPDVDFLVANVTMQEASLVVKFSINPTGLARDLSLSLTFQLKRMRLNARYRDQVNIFLFSQRTGMLRIHEKSGRKGLREYLRSSAQGLSRDFGRNDWRAALMRGLLQCDAFCNGGLEGYFAAGRRKC